ncbi:MAG TPA: rhodanese-like domain-containing protein [Bryobacteraceae bacterium]|nr:rhodanese-like domain-containing protein [Bryobacteraceae bacterium]
MRSLDDGGNRPRDFFAANQERWLADLQKDLVMVVDVRPPESFAAGFLPGSLNVPAPSCLSPLAGSAFFEDREVLFIAEEEGTVVETRAWFQRSGHPAGVGWFSPAILSLWRQKVGPLAKIEEISADNLAVRIAAWKTLVLDVRGGEQDQMARIPESIQIPLEELLSSIIGLPLETNLTVVCETGQHSSLAGSLLWRLGYRNLSTLTGGMKSYVRRGLRVVTQASNPAL